MQTYPTHGITTTTVKNFMVGAGAAYVNFGEATGERLLGATKGGNNFKIEQDIREAEPDGRPGPVKGMRDVVEVRPQITLTLMEMTKDNFLLAIAGSSATPYPDATAATHDSIKRNRQINTDTDYIKNIALVGKTKGSEQPAVFIIKNGLSDDNFEIGTEDKAEATLDVTFTGHYDPATMEEEPWEILWPKTTP